jgi:hypothetical protein
MNSTPPIENAHHANYSEYQESHQIYNPCCDYYSETTKVPFLGSTAALCLSITKYIEVSQLLWPLAQYLTREIDSKIKQRRIC